MQQSQRCCLPAQVLENAAPGSALLEEDLAEGAVPADAVQQEAEEAAASAGVASDALLPAQVEATIEGTPAVDIAVAAVVTQATEADPQSEVHAASVPVIATLSEQAAAVAASEIDATAVTELEAKIELQPAAAEIAAATDGAAEAATSAALAAAVEATIEPETVAEPSQEAEALVAEAELVQVTTADAAAANADMPDQTPAARSELGEEPADVQPEPTAAHPVMATEADADVGASAMDAPASSAGVDAPPAGAVSAGGVGQEVAAHPEASAAAPPATNGAAAPTAGVKRPKWDAPAPVSAGAGAPWWSRFS